MLTLEPPQKVLNLCPKAPFDSRLVLARAGSKRQAAQRELQAEEKQQMDTAQMALLPKKKRRLLQRMQYTEKMKAGNMHKLEEKKIMIETGGAFVNSEGIIEYKTV